MGPPPPPPPPPPQLSSKTLPSGGWKTAKTPRCNNNSVPAAPDKTRPTVDSAALQHAAARLRKTGYYEQIRGDVPNLPNGGVAGPDQRLSDGNRPHGTQLVQLDLDSSREQVHATPAHSYHTDSISNLRGRTNPGVTLQGNGEPSLPPTYEQTPKSHYRTYNNSYSNLSERPYADQKLDYLPSTATSPHSSSYTAYRTEQQPLYRNVSPQQAYAPPHYENQPYTPNLLERQPYARPTYETRPYGTPQPFSNVYNNYETHSTSEIRREESQKTRPTETTLTWDTPYVPPSSSPILDPHARIREFATTNYVEPDPPPTSHEYVRTVRRETHSRTTAPNDFATILRDQGLTSTQREANQHQTSTLRRDRLPFDVDQLYKKSYSGDEVDLLVNNMQTGMHLTRTQVPLSSASSNECVACKAPITDASPGCTALDQIFHVNCFKCKTCGKRLAGSSFYNIDNNPTCKPCYEETLEKCHKCQNKITDRLLRAKGHPWHVQCFTCMSCQRALDGVPFTSDPQDNVYCVSCYQEKFAPRCAVCTKPIVPREGEKESVRVIAMDKSFHPTCYRCEDCGLQLSSKVDGAACYPLDSHLYCKTCNGNRLRAQAAA